MRALTCGKVSLIERFNQKLFYKINVTFLFYFWQRFHRDIYLTNDTNIEKFKEEKNSGTSNSDRTLKAKKSLKIL